MIENGAVDTVLGDEEAMKSKLQVEAIDYDKDVDDREVFYSHYESALHDIPFSITHSKQVE